MSKARYRTFMQNSWKEYKKYQSTRQDIYLAQAGEKLWGAFNMLMEQKTGQKLRNFSQVRNAVGSMYSKTGQRLYVFAFEDTYRLHRYFYRGWTSDPEGIEREYLNAYNELKILEAQK